MQSAVTAARRGVAAMEAALDEAEAMSLELDDLNAVLWEIRAVMSVAPEVPHHRLADLLWERHYQGGTTHARADEAGGAEGAREEDDAERRSA
jgi:hypothetical protein